MSPLGGGRDMLDPLARLGRGSPYGIMRGGGLGAGGLGVGVGVGGMRAGILGGGPLGVRGRGLHPGAFYGNRGALGVDVRGDPLSQALQLGRYPRGLEHSLGRHGGHDALALLPYERYRAGGGWPHGSDCDTGWRERLFHDREGHHGHGCGCRRSCGESSNSNSKSNFDFKTKDVTIRGKARAVRASYLAEAAKFEGDVTKYMEKKSQEEVPDRVIDMLISYINREEYSNNSVFDEVTLNILASNVGAKSAVDYSLARLKDSTGDLDADELSLIIALILLSGKVDDGLRKWLANYLKDGDRISYLDRSHSFQEVIDEKPELYPEIQRLLGLRVDRDPSLLRIL
jgi:hypothetical protein